MPISYDYFEKTDLESDLYNKLNIVRDFFPRCWATLAPLYCVLRYRPCSLKRPTTNTSNQNTSHYISLERFSAHFCWKVKQDCASLENFGESLLDTLNCEDGSVFSVGCKLNFVEYHQMQNLSRSAKCAAPLVHYRLTERNAPSSATLVVDDCFLPCSSALFSGRSVHFFRLSSGIVSIVLLIVAIAKFIIVIQNEQISWCLASSSSFSFNSQLFYMATNVLALLFVFFYLIMLSLTMAGEMQMAICLEQNIRRTPEWFDAENSFFDWCALQVFLQLGNSFASWACFIASCNKRLPSPLQIGLAVFHITVSAFWLEKLAVDPVLGTCRLSAASSYATYLFFCLFTAMVATAIFWVSRGNSSRQRKANTLLVEEAETTRDCVRSAKECAFGSGIFWMWLLSCAFYSFSFNFLPTMEQEKQILGGHIKQSVSQQALAGFEHIKRSSANFSIKSRCIVISDPLSQKSIHFYYLNVICSFVYFLATILILFDQIVIGCRRMMVKAKRKALEKGIEMGDMRRLQPAEEDKHDGSNSSCYARIGENRIEAQLGEGYASANSVISLPTNYSQIDQSIYQEPGNVMAPLIRAGSEPNMQNNGIKFHGRRRKLDRLTYRKWKNAHRRSISQERATATGQQFRVQTPSSDLTELYGQVTNSPFATAVHPNCPPQCTECILTQMIMAMASLNQPIDAWLPQMPQSRCSFSAFAACDPKQMYEPFHFYQPPYNSGCHPLLVQCLHGPPQSNATPEAPNEVENETEGEDGDLDLEGSSQDTTEDEQSQYGDGEEDTDVNNSDESDSEEERRWEETKKALETKAN